MSLRLSSWNVNGVRAASKKGLMEYVQTDLPDVLCLQETKARAEQFDSQWLSELGYDSVWNSAEKAGYSGVSTWTRVPAKRHRLGMGITEHDAEGRVLTSTFDDFHLVNVYTPNSQNELRRLPYRIQWDAAFLDYVRRLRRRKPVIVCGDLNVSHKEIDLANPKSNRRNAGFTDEEREAVDRMIDGGLRDSLRHFDDAPKRYTWWTYRGNARARNVGWRLDYFMVDRRLIEATKSSTIRPDIHGSDHCPVEIEIAV